MKLNNNMFKFVKNFKYWLIFPIIMLCVAIILGSIFGFNYDYDFKKVSTFDVKFNVTVTSEEYNILEDKLQSMVEGAEIDSYEISRIGNGANNGFTLRVVNNGSLDDEIINLKADIDDNLYDSVQSQLISSVNISTTNINTILPKNVNRIIWYSLLAVACICLFVFIYNVIRYSLASAITSVLTILFDVVLLTCIYLVARIPVNTNFALSYFVMILLSIVITTYINNLLKNTLNDDKYAKYSNEDRVYSVIGNSFGKLTIVGCILLVSLISVMIFSNVSQLYTILGIIAGVLVSYFASIVFNFGVWSFIYNKEKDARLRRRIEKEKSSKTDKKEDEKILV